MTTDSPDNRDDPRSPEWLSEDEAHRLLARAVELDSRRASDISLAQLREVAGEAGISSEAFDRALQEIRVGDLTPRANTTLVRRASSRWLAKYRRHAAVLILTAIAGATRGDVAMPFLIYGVPLYGLYELAILLVRRGDRRGGRPSPPTPMAGDASDSERPRRDGSSRLTHSMALKPRLTVSFT